MAKTTENGCWAGKKQKNKKQNTDSFRALESMLFVG